MSKVKVIECWSNLELDWPEEDGSPRRYIYRNRQHADQTRAILLSADNWDAVQKKIASLEELDRRSEEIITTYKEAHDMQRVEQCGRRFGFTKDTGQRRRKGPYSRSATVGTNSACWPVEDQRIGQRRTKDGRREDRDQNWFGQPVRFGLGRRATDAPLMTG